MTKLIPQKNIVQRSDFAVGLEQSHLIIKCVGPDFQNKKLAGPAILSVSYSRVWSILKMSHD